MDLVSGVRAFAEVPIALCARVVRVQRDLPVIDFWAVCVPARTRPDPEFVYGHGHAYDSEPQLRRAFRLAKIRYGFLPDSRATCRTLSKSGRATSTPVLRA